MRVLGPMLYTLLVWWASTGVILYLNGLPRRWHPPLMGAATVLLAVALCGVAVSADDTRVTGAYLAFTAAIAVWGWQELAFLLGYLTGPRRHPCPSQATGWPRAGHAIMAILWHELTLVVLATAILWLCWGRPNPVAVWTFAVLWVMRLSAKLNVFLGVRNLSEQFLPEHLRYLQSYFRRRPRNSLFATSVLVGTLCAGAVWQAATHPDASPFAATGATLVATLLSLAVVEHWFMVLPLPSEKLWNWGMRSRR
ncbi:putative photosynthetic complex assembly protein PuhE [Pseudacidovorax sp. RU35E]|uniref:putative photosynthetic complex assembly protein PuhE n=1 Tax=Pseudacidovorax sp. RU35E TaxID=1907403 RepID=UPI000953F505|nr:putative photosynthetic complex assembly protein PuhE [Pseudacidovorax sp. RU35E]SIR60066.1 putative photosynthetic complex assembly protein 2 [Pseudacidovorax sp. RU35E]